MQTFALLSLNLLQVIPLQVYDSRGKGIFLFLGLQFSNKVKYVIEPIIIKYITCHSTKNVLTPTIRFFTESRRERERDFAGYTDRGI